MKHFLTSVLVLLLFWRFNDLSAQGGDDSPCSVFISRIYTPDLQLMDSLSGAMFAGYELDPAGKVHRQLWAPHPIPAWNGSSAPSYGKSAVMLMPRSFIRTPTGFDFHSTLPPANKRLVILYLEDTMVVDFIGCHDNFYGGYAMDSLVFMPGHFQLHMASFQSIPENYVEITDYLPPPPLRGLTPSTWVGVAQLPENRFMPTVKPATLDVEDFSSSYHVGSAWEHFEKDSAMVLAELAKATAKKGGVPDCDILLCYWQFYQYHGVVDSMMRYLNQAVDCRLIGVYPDNARAFRIYHYGQLGQHDKALADFDTLISRAEPGDERNGRRYERAHYRLNQMKDAENARKEIKQVLQESKPVWFWGIYQLQNSANGGWFLLGEAELALGNTSAAFDAFAKSAENGSLFWGRSADFLDSLLALHPGSPSLQFACGVAKAANGYMEHDPVARSERYQLALALLDQAASGGYPSHEVHMQKAVIYLIIREYVSAVEAIRSVHRSQRRDPRYYYLLSRVIARDDWKEAERAMRRAEKYGYIPYEGE